MRESVRVCLVGAGAFGVKHLEAIQEIEGLDVVALADSELDKARAIAQRFSVPQVGTDMHKFLLQPDIDAVILCTPTQLHASQAIACLNAGKHVQVEIPMADNLANAQELVRVQQQTGLVAMAGHTRRFNPSHQWIRREIAAGNLKIQQLDVQTFFMRRQNLNALGEPRSWTDHLLWHHACHTVDLFQYQIGEIASKVNAMQGPLHSKLGIAMDMSLQMKAPSGALCTLSLSFNNDGPFGSFFRYICDNGTYLASYDELYDGYDKPVDLSDIASSFNGIELQDRDFLRAITTGTESMASVSSVLPAYQTLYWAEKSLY